MNRNRILQAASEMFCKFGLRGDSIDDMCGSVGIGKKTFYTCYADKNDLVKEFVEASFSAMHHALLEDSMPHDAIQKLKMFDSQLVNFLIFRAWPSLPHLRVMKLPSIWVRYFSKYYSFLNNYCI